MSGDFTAEVRRSGRGERASADTFQLAVTVVGADVCGFPNKVEATG
jgi:hypothetical protein